MNTIRETRKKAGLTLEQISLSTNINISILSRIENEKRPLRATEVSKIARVLQCTIPELLGEVPMNTSESNAQTLAAVRALLLKGEK